MSLEQILAFGTEAQISIFLVLFTAQAFYTSNETNKLDLNARNCRKSGEEQRRPCGWTSCCHLKQICRLGKRK